MGESHNAGRHIRINAAPTHLNPLKRSTALDPALDPQIVVRLVRDGITGLERNGTQKSKLEILDDTMKNTTGKQNYIEASKMEHAVHRINTLLLAQVKDRSCNNIFKNQFLLCGEKVLRE
ncbi:hypothetical protein O0L34_g13908 [Tuta absoluta]|nr:hypothetical protein O0L34_g13908 [Tuta absoluta]